MITVSEDTHLELQNTRVVVDAAGANQSGKTHWIDNLKVKTETDLVLQSGKDEKSGFFVCNYCRYETDTKKDFNQHRKKHIGEPFECKSCDYKTAYKSELVIHERYHTGDLFECTSCDYKTSLKKNFVLH